MHTHNRLTASVTIALTASLASADITGVYQDRDLFNNNIGAVIIEDFESEAVGSFATPTIFDSGLGVDFADGGVSTYIDFAENYGFENSTPGGQNYMAFGNDGDIGNYTVEYTFETSIREFGFEISGFQPSVSDQDLNFVLMANGQILYELSISTPNDFSIQFFGLITNTNFDTVRVTIGELGANDADYVAFDDVTFSVPTPSTAALLALGALATTRRRR